MADNTPIIDINTLKEVKSPETVTHRIRKRTCPTCHNIYETEVGLTDKNLKKLFRIPNSYEIVIFIMLVFSIAVIFQYLEEKKFIRENIEEICYAELFNWTITNSTPTPTIQEQLDLLNKKASIYDPENICDNTTYRNTSENSTCGS